MNIYFYLFGHAGSWLRQGCGTRDLRSLWWCAGSLVVVCKPSVAACGIQFPDQGLDLGPLHWECGVIAIGPPEKSRDDYRFTCFCKKQHRDFLYTFPSFPQWYHFAELQYNFTTRISALLKFNEMIQSSLVLLVLMCVICILLNCLCRFIHHCDQDANSSNTTRSSSVALLQPHPSPSPAREPLATSSQHHPRDFPGGPVVKTPCFQSWGYKFNPWLGN